MVGHRLRFTKENKWLPGATVVMFEAVILVGAAAFSVVASASRRHRWCTGSGGDILAAGKEKW